MNYGYIINCLGIDLLFEVYFADTTDVYLVRVYFGGGFGGFYGGGGGFGGGGASGGW